MATLPPAPATGLDRDDQLRLAVLIGYGLYAAAIFTVGLSTIAGLILAYIKRADAAGTIWEGHCTWLIRTFWIDLLLMVGGLIPWGAAPIGAMVVAGPANANGVLGWVLAGLFLAATIGSLVLWFGGVIWFIYRVVKGGLAALDRRSFANPRGFL